MANYFLAYIALGLFLIASLAVLNWKMPYERASKWAILPMISLPIGSYLISTSIMHHAWVDGAANPDSMYLMFVPSAMLLPLPLTFVASSYIQHLKDRADLRIAQKAIRDAVISHIATVIVIASFILFVLYPGS